MLPADASNYGPVNWITFNFGMHTEHHDFHYIPWFRLGRLREVAPEFYNDLKQTHSFSGLAFQFAFGTREAFNNEEYRNQKLFDEDEREPGSEFLGTRTATTVEKEEPARI